MLFLAGNHCNALSRHLLGHFLMRGRVYVLNHDILHSQLFGYPPIHLTIDWYPTEDPYISLLSAQATNQNVSPLKTAQLSRYKCKGSSSCITSNHTIHNSAHWLDLPVPDSNHTASILGWTVTTVHYGIASWLDPLVYQVSAGCPFFPFVQGLGVMY